MTHSGSWYIKLHCFTVVPSVVYHYFRTDPNSLDKKQLGNMGFRVLFIFVAIMLLNYTNAQPLGAIDTCLLNCESCFKEEAVLLKCANECLRNGYFKMNPLWKSMCPYFGDLDFTAH